MTRDEYHALIHEIEIHAEQGSVGQGNLLMDLLRFRVETEGLDPVAAPAPETRPYVLNDRRQASIPANRPRLCKALRDATPGFSLHEAVHICNLWAAGESVPLTEKMRNVLKGAGFPTDLVLTPPEEYPARIPSHLLARSAAAKARLKDTP